MTRFKGSYYKNKYILIWIPNCGPIKVGVKKFVTEIIVENVNSLDKRRGGVELSKVRVLCCQIENKIQ
jgi:hypothetical protein